MDILTARKKAAERARGKQTQAVAAADQPAPDMTPEAESAPQQRELPTQATEQAVVQQPPSPPSVADVAESPVVIAAPPAQDVTQEQSLPIDPANDAVATVPEIELLSFKLSGEEYAIMVDDVREVLKRREVTSVPNTAEHILGVTSLRGMMLTVLDLAIRLGLPRTERDEKSRIIVVGFEDEPAGLIVDRVTGVFRVLPDAIKPVPDNIEQGVDMLRGIVRKNEKLYIILDLEKAAGA